MKRVFQCLAVICLIISMAVPACAARMSHYRIEELGMSIDIPSNYIVLTRNAGEDALSLETYGISKSELESSMKQTGTYLAATTIGFDREISVVKMSSDVEDPNSVSDEKLMEMGEALRLLFENAGGTVQKPEIYQNKQTKFVKTGVTVPKGGSVTNIVQYWTIYGRKQIIITLYCHSGKIDSAQEDMMKNVIDSISFESTRVPAFVYTEPVSGLRLTVPENWGGAPEVESTDENLRLIFRSNLDDNIYIGLGILDVWEQLPIYRRLLTQRSKIDNSLFTKSDIAPIVHSDRNKISVVSYGGREYFDADSVRGDKLLKSLVRFENGYMYLFLFNGDGGSPYFDDFIDLVSGAEYPEAIKAGFRQPES